MLLHAGFAWWEILLMCSLKDKCSSMVTPKDVFIMNLMASYHTDFSTHGMLIAVNEILSYVS